MVCHLEILSIGLHILWRHHHHELRRWNCQIASESMLEFGRKAKSLPAQLAPTGSSRNSIALCLGYIWPANCNIYQFINNKTAEMILTTAILLFAMTILVTTTNKKQKTNKQTTNQTNNLLRQFRCLRWGSWWSPATLPAFWPAPQARLRPDNKKLKEEEK